MRRIAAYAVLALLAAAAGCTFDGSSPREQVAPARTDAKDSPEAPDDSLEVYTTRLRRRPSLRIRRRPAPDAT